MHFVVIGIEPPHVSTALTAIKSISNGRISKPAHITIQGPFESSEVPAKKLGEIRSRLQSVTLRAVGTDFFQNEEKCVLFLKTSSHGLETVWSKPDFPVERFGMNPHITLYEGTDADFVSLLRETLNDSFVEGLELCASKIEVMGSDTADYTQHTLDVARLIYPREYIGLDELQSRLEENSVGTRIDLIKDVILRTEAVRLSDRDFELLTAKLEDAPEPNEALRKLLRS